MVKNRMLLVFLALMLTVLTVAGGACRAEPDDMEGEWPDKPLAVVAGGVTMANYLSTIAWTPLHEADTGAKWRVLAEHSSPTVARWLKAGAVEFWATSIPTPVDTIEARHGFATREGGPFQIRLVWGVELTLAGVAVRGDSDIRTLDDIEPGAKYSVWIGSPQFIQFYEMIRAYLDMTPEELISVDFGSYTTACRALGEGRVDLSFLTAADALAYELAAGPHGIRYLEFPEGAIEAEKRLHEVAPTLMFGSGQFGVEESRGVRGYIFPFAYQTTSDTDPEMIYRIVKWLHENFDAYEDLTEATPRMSIDYFRAALDNTYIPVHEGTIRYLKEIEMWTAADDARQEYNVWLVTRYIDAYEAALAMADEEMVRVNPDNEEWIELWENYKEEIGIPRFKLMSDEEIAAALTELK